MKFKWLSLIILCLGQLLTMSDNQLVLISIQAFTKHLGATTVDIQNAQLYYPLIAGAFMIVAGLAGIYVGFIKLFRLGVVLVAIAEMLVYFSTNMTVVVLARILCGFAGGVLVPSVLGLIVAIYKDPKDRAVAFAAIGSVIGLASIVAPVVLGNLSVITGWRFPYMVIAIYGLSLLGLSFLLQKSEQQRPETKFDFVGAVLVVISIVCFLVGLGQMTQWGVFLATSFAPFSIIGISPAFLLVLFALALFTIFLKYEMNFEAKGGVALMPISFFTKAIVAIGLLEIGMVFFIATGPLYLFVIYIQNGLGYNAAQTASFISVFSISIVTSSIFIPKLLLPRVTGRQLFFLANGSGVLAAILFMFAIYVDDLNVPITLLALIVFGINNATLLVIGPMFVTQNITEREAQQSGGAQGSSRNVLQAMGIAMATIILSFFLGLNFHSAVNSSDMSDSAKESLSSLERVDFFPDARIASLAESLNIQGEDVDKLVTVNSYVRLKSLKQSLFVCAIVIALTLLLAFKVPATLLVGAGNKKQK